MQTPAPFDYERATSLEGAIASLKQHEDSRVVAGGHSLLPMMKLRLATPEYLVDINDLHDELGYVRVGVDEVRIGAMTRHRELLESAELAALFPIFADAEAVIADPVVRNRGTIGGSLCQADAAEDLSAVCAALKATVTIAGADRGHVRADVEVLHRDGPLTTASARGLVTASLVAADDHECLRGAAHRRQILRRVGLAQRPADRAAVADHRVGDDLLGVAEQREPRCQQVGLQEVDVARHRADLDHPLVLADVGEVGQVVDVDQVRGLGEPQLHHREQAVAAGDDPRLRAEPLERRDRALDAGRTLVLEWRRGLHGAPLLRQDCLAGNRLRGWPMSSRRSYCSGEPEPITGERGSSAAPGSRPSG